MWLEQSCRASRGEEGPKHRARGHEIGQQGASAGSLAGEGRGQTHAVSGQKSRGTLLVVAAVLLIQTVP